MIGIPKPKNPSNNLSPFSHKMAGVWVVLTFLMVFAGGSVVGQNLTTPTYVWQSAVDLPTVNASFSGVNTDDITISVATDPKGNVYSLSFGKGVAKRSATGALINANFIPSSRLDSPLDMAIDDNGFIYIADYFAGGETFTDNGKIWVFSPEGALINSQTIYTSFYRPLGVDVDEENVYVAEFNDGNSGPESNQLSRIRIYDKNSGDPLSSTANVDTPFRIAVDSQKRIFVSQAGNGNPSVRIYTRDLIFQSTLPNILSPGSIVIDPFDFIHVIEYDGRIDFSQFINFEKLTLSQVQSIAKRIDDGQKVNAFSIKIFDPNWVLKSTFKDQIDFPVDHTFNICDKMYVNNAEIFGGPSIIGYLPSKLEFDLEIYQRSPGFDLQKPVLICPADITVTAALGASSAVVNYTAPIPTDNCSTLELTRDGPAQGSTFPLGPTTITYTAEDAAGNVETCSFTITVNPAEEEDDTEDPVITCPPNITQNVDANVCGAVVNYIIPTATDNSGTPTVTRTTGLAPGEVFPVGTTEVTYRAEDAAGNTASCSFTVTVTDNIDPSITCPGNQTETYNSSTGFTLPDYRVQATATDNCGNPSISQTPPAGTLIIQNTQVILRAKDNSGNIHECSFTVELSEEIVLEITCPQTQSGALVANCQFTVPDYKSLAQVNKTGATITQSPVAGTVISSSTPITLTAEFGDENDTCIFQLTLSDFTDPVISCPGDQTEIYNSSTGFTLPDYRDQATSTDNCAIQSVTQSPAVGTVINQDTEVTLRATDSSGNFHECTFMVNLSENEVLKIDCPPDQLRQLDVNCQFIVKDYTGLATVNFGNANVTQIPVQGTIVNSEITIKLTANLNGQTDDCSFQLILEDSIAPEASCVGEYSLSLNAEGSANLSATEINLNSTDHCGIASIVIDKTLFTFNNLGENAVILTVTDTAGNVDSCSTIVRVLIGDYVPGNFECKSPIVIQLDETGNATISSSDLYTGDPGDRNFVLSKTSFNCSNIGNNQVDFSYSGNDGSGTCGINVIVEDRISPEVRTRNIHVTLNSFGTATITPEMIDNGSSDNCSTPQLSLDLSTFNCNDLGENVVILTATDTSGNTASLSAIVTVTGICKEIPETGFEYIFIYPNPTPGPFTFDTPNGWSIEKVEVFDTRGRYVLTETYSENQVQYSMDLSSLQQAVYILKLYTSQGIKIIRVIIY